MTVNKNIKGNGLKELFQHCPATTRRGLEAT
jgi:hypothetical protein